MLDAILAATDDYPSFLHRHVLQYFAIKHRRGPRSDAEQRRAVYEYLVRTRHDTTGTVKVIASPELCAWLDAPDETVKGWGPVPRLSAILHRFSGDLRKRFDLAAERDYHEFACYVALTLQSALHWPEEIVGESVRRVTWESAPGIPTTCRVGVTRALNHVRRNAAPVRALDLRRPDALGQLLLLVLSDVDSGKLPSYVLSPAQWELLEQPAKLPGSKIRLSGLLHHLVVERGVVAPAALAQADVAEAVRREIPRMLGGLRLPRRLRAAHGLREAAVTSIRDAARDARDPIVTVVGPLGHGSGLGAATRACTEALKAAGIASEALNLVADWGRNDEHRGEGLVDHARGDINIIHFNPDVIVENVAQFGLEQFEGRYNIGHFFWETSKACLAHRIGMELVDEIWVSTEYCRDVFAAVTGKPVHVVRTPVPRIDDVSWATPEYFGIRPGRFTYVFTFDGASRFTRKNAIAVVRAFQQAFPGDAGVQLVIKTQNTGWLTGPDERQYAQIREAARRDDRILVIDESFSSNEVHALISVCDCYVALHRSEGFGLGMAEAMSLGVPVVATGYSGNADFTTEATAYPVRYTLVPVPKTDFVYDEPGQEWADPDVGHAASRMVEVRSDPGRAAKVARARDFIRARYDVTAVAEIYRERIEAIRSALGTGAGGALAGAGARA